MATRKVEFLKRFFGPTPKDELEYGGRARGIISVPEEFAYCGSFLTPEEKVLWLILLAHCRNRDSSMRISWPSQERLAHLMGRSDRQVRRYVKELVRKGCLQTLKRINETSLYRLLDPPKSEVVRTNKQIARIKEIEKLAESARAKVASNLKLPSPPANTTNVRTSLEKA